MPRWIFFALFIAIVVSVLGGLHYYLWARLIRAPAWPQPWTRRLTVGLVFLGGSLPLALSLGRAVPSIGRFIFWPAYLWLGLMFLLVVAVAASDLMRLPLGLVHRFSNQPIDFGRRQWLARLWAGGSVVVAGAFGLYAVREALGHIRVRRVEIRLKKLAAEQDGLRIAQISDVHIGPTLRAAFLEQVVQRTNDLAPDLVAITGDLVDGSVAELQKAVRALGKLRAKHGVFFVTGNHEYFSGARAWVTELGLLGVRVLRNERVTIGEGPFALELAGTDDPTAHRYPEEGHGEDLPRALAGRDPARPVVLLAHQPKTVHEAARLGVDLQLSGHTHGGQIWPFRYAVLLQQPVVAGLARFGETQIYVSRGTGFWGPPMRLGAPAEITEVILRREA